MEPTATPPIPPSPPEAIASSAGHPAPPQAAPPIPPTPSPQPSTQPSLTSSPGLTGNNQPHHFGKEISIPGLTPDINEPTGPGKVTGPTPPTPPPVPPPTPPPEPPPPPPPPKPIPPPEPPTPPDIPSPPVEISSPGKISDQKDHFGKEISIPGLTPDINEPAGSVKATSPTPPTPPPVPPPKPPPPTPPPEPPPPPPPPKPIPPPEPPTPPDIPPELPAEEKIGVPPIPKDDHHFDKEIAIPGLDDTKDSSSITPPKPSSLPDAPPPVPKAGPPLPPDIPPKAPPSPEPPIEEKMGVPPMPKDDHHFDKEIAIPGLSSSPPTPPTIPPSSPPLPGPPASAMPPEPSISPEPTAPSIPATPPKTPSSPTEIPIEIEEKPSIDTLPIGENSPPIEIDALETPPPPPPVQAAPAPASPTSEAPKKDELQGAVELEVVETIDDEESIPIDVEAPPQPEEEPVVEMQDDFPPLELMEIPDKPPTRKKHLFSIESRPVDDTSGDEIAAPPAPPGGTPAQETSQASPPPGAESFHSPTPPSPGQVSSPPSPLQPTPIGSQPYGVQPQAPHPGPSIPGQPSPPAQGAAPQTMYRPGQQPGQGPAPAPPPRPQRPQRQIKLAEQPEPPKPDSQLKRILQILLLIGVFAVVIYLMVKPGAKDGGNVPVSPGGSPQPTAVSPVTSKSKQIDFNNTTLFNDPAGFYSITLPAGYTRSDESGFERSKITFTYPDRTLLTILATPMKTEWNAEQAMQDKVAEIQEGRAGELSFYKVISSKVLTIGSATGYEIVLEKTGFLSHFYLLVTPDNSSVTINLITEGRHRQHTHDSMIMEIEGSLEIF